MTYNFNTKISRNLFDLLLESESSIHFPKVCNEKKRSSTDYKLFENEIWLTTGRVMEFAPFITFNSSLLDSFTVKKSFTPFDLPVNKVQCFQFFTWSIQCYAAFRNNSFHSFPVINSIQQFRNNSPGSERIWISWNLWELRELKVLSSWKLPYSPIHIAQNFSIHLH